MKDKKNLENPEAIGKDATPSAKDKKVEKAAPKKTFGDSLRKTGKSLSKWGRDLKGEAKKIVWPGWKQTKNNTIVVLSVIGTVGAAIWIMDLVFENIILKGLLAIAAGF